jgi:DNA-binding transcriptional regulator LsrR (DeoR family)
MEKKRRKFTFKEKGEIICFYDENISIKSKTEISKELNISRSTLNTILENRNQLEFQFQNSTINLKRSHHRTSFFPLLDKCLFIWINNINSNKLSVPVDTNILQSAGNKFRELLNIEEKISEGYLQRLRERYNLKSLKISGYKESADEEAFQQWKLGTLHYIEKNYDAKDIFNLDETGFFIFFF